MRTRRALLSCALLLVAACAKDALPASGSDGGGILSDMTAPLRCGGLAGMSCPSGMYCETPPAECCCDIPGVCKPLPGGCSKEYAPVCACDGKTYGNDCLRQAAGASLDHTGACELPPPPPGFMCGGALCMPGQVCFQQCSGIGPPPPPYCKPPPDGCGPVATCAACFPPMPFVTCTDAPGGGVYVTRTGCD